MSEETTGSNPGAEDTSVEDAVFGAGSSDNFFEDLDKGVNGAIQENDEASVEVTQKQSSGSEQVTHEQQEGSDTEDNGSESWKKRYSDSSREAVKLRSELDDLKPFVPVLDAMRKDSGLVNHVRDYLQNGGKPSPSIQEQLQLNEDFVFDPQDAVTDGESDSAKLMNAHVDTIVQQRVGQMLQAEKQNAAQVQHKAAKKAEELAFKEKRGMTDEQFGAFIQQAKKHTLTLEDVDHLLNREQVAANVADSTKEDMLTQMKNVRNMPTSASGANSQAKQTSEDKDVFDKLLGLDSDLDNLFGQVQVLSLSERK